ncbi:TPA: DNA-binding response regulator [Citrobacter amalonaticus]|uniref:transcriptional regulator n=1 Tax=Citrobacter TaxID=544 RepID=UPI0005CA7ACA|nr:MULTISPECIES: transcriptional regulator [Citrobacter]KKF71406.1 transcriptional regulator [Vibrio parahaemolyticus]AUZ64550.1 transcriptional regulator [Citrobacter sp. CFNIH10]EKW3843195.1 DNA-binding response regulator [Citrobacter amalonaticus]EKW5056584.1 DNA-binding response regulator [Citrobacter amalonaticus]EKX8493627.1 DNA-binding response regulator [Citrobacter amalonaticus]
MVYQCFLYNKDLFFSQGIKTVIASLLAEKTDVLYSLTDDYTQLIKQLQTRVNDDCRLWILCDLDSLPHERIRALQLMNNFYQRENKNLIILLSEHNMPLFFTLYALLPNAHWLLKSENLANITPFFQELLDQRRQGCCFSYSLVNYTRRRLHHREMNYTISGNEWWLMEEIFKGKSLSQISGEVNIDVRRLSYIKRHLMKRLNIRNNIALFTVFKGIMPCDP